MYKCVYMFISKPFLQTPKPIHNVQSYSEIPYKFITVRAYLSYKVL